MCLPGWAGPANLLSQRHDLLPIRLWDPREVELPDVGVILVEDSETGEQLTVDTSDKNLRRRFYEAAQRREAELAETFARELGPEDITLLCDPVYFGGTVDRSEGSERIVDLIAKNGGKAIHINTREGCGDWLVANARPGDRIAIMGARDDTLSVFAVHGIGGIWGALATGIFAVEAIGGYRTGDMPEDYDLWLRLVLAGHRIANAKETVVELRDHCARLTRTDSRYRQVGFDRCRRNFLEARVLPHPTRVVLWAGRRGGRPWLRWLQQQGHTLPAVIDISQSTVWAQVPVMPPSARSATGA
mgnify:CR=1 FL=1